VCACVCVCVCVRACATLTARKFLLCSSRASSDRGTLPRKGACPPSMPMGLLLLLPLLLLLSGNNPGVEEHTCAHCVHAARHAHWLLFVRVPMHARMHASGPALCMQRHSTGSRRECGRVSFASTPLPLPRGGGLSPPVHRHPPGVLLLGQASTSCRPRAGAAARRASSACSAP